MTTLTVTRPFGGLFGFLGQAAEVQVAQWTFYGVALAALCTLAGVVINTWWTRDMRRNALPQAATAATEAATTNTTEHAAAVLNVSTRMDAMDDRLDETAHSIRGEIRELRDDMRGELGAIHRQLSELAQSIIRHFDHLHTKETPHVGAHQGEGGSGSEGDRGGGDTDPDDAGD